MRGPASISSVSASRETERHQVHLFFYCRATSVAPPGGGAEGELCILADTLKRQYPISSSIYSQYAL
jgi:hypothetical protein